MKNIQIVTDVKDMQDPRYNDDDLKKNNKKESIKMSHALI